jgi:hypothetical protein
MMKLLFFFLACSVAFSAVSFAKDVKNYTLKVDGQTLEINPGDTVATKTKSGEVLSITLQRKEFGTFQDGNLSFEYRGDLSVASTDVQSDIHQYLVASALGTLLIVQKYDKINPASLTEFMLKQMTDGDVAAFAKLESADFTRTLADGTVMKGLKATVTSETDHVVLEVLAADLGVGGVMAMSRINTDQAQTEQAIIDRFWSTLRTKP